MPTEAIYNCSRCGNVTARDASAKFCPACGHSWVAASVEPLRLVTDKLTIDVGAELGRGSTARLYVCATSSPAAPSGVLKVAREPAGTEALRREASSLRTLANFADASAVAPFVPRWVDSFRYVEANAPAREANVLAYDERVGDPFSLYSLAEVRTAYPQGVDARDAAWMFRRLLHLLSLVHAADIGHGAIVPHHVLIEPRDHKLLVVGWSAVQPLSAMWRAGDDAIATRWMSGVATTVADADLILAARTFVYLVGGDVDALAPPASLDAGIARFLERCIAGCDVSGSRTAMKLLADFDRLIEALWGPRVFRPFTMPPRAGLR